MHVSPVAGLDWTLGHAGPANQTHIVGELVSDNMSEPEPPSVV
jgi:hypothetical protein